MTKKILSIVDGGLNVFFTGTVAEFKVEAVAAAELGFTSPDLECEWSDDANHVLDYAESQQCGFGEVVWVARDGHAKIMLVVG